MDLKAQIKGELVKQKEEKLQKEKEINSNLKEITLYTGKNNPVCENYKKYYTENGIKFKEKDISLHNEVTAIVQNNAVPVIFINDNYLVHGRDFQNPQQSTGAIRHFANPDYVNPPFGSIIHEGKKKGPTAWVRKALEEYKKGKDIVFLYPLFIIFIQFFIIFFNIF